MNIPFVAGKKGFLQIQGGTGPTTWDIPALVGTGVAVPTNDRLLTAASAGQSGAGASNVVAGIPTPVLNVSTTAMSSFFTSAFLNALLVTRDANFDLAMLDFKYSNGIDVFQDSGKLRSIRIAFDRGSNTIGLDMQFLLTNVNRSKTWSAYNHPEGAAEMACGASPSFDPDGATAAFLIYGAIGESITIDTGATGMKFTGGTEACQQLTHIAAPTASGVISIDQGAGAEKRLDAYSSGKFSWGLDTGGFAIELGARRMDKALPMNPMGAADSITSWALYGGNDGATFITIE